MSDIANKLYRLLFMISREPHRAHPAREELAAYILSLEARISKLEKSNG